MKVAWVNGWSLPSFHLLEMARRFWPCGEHVVLPAASDVEASLARLPDLDWIMGFSLGAHLLLRMAQSPVLSGKKVGLLAPFFSWPEESGLGGRVKLTQLKYLRRWLERDSREAVGDFYQRIGYTGRREEVLDLPTLNWGLSVLIESNLPLHIPFGWKSVIGERDPLLNAVRLRELCPSISVVEDAGHDLERLLPAWQDLVLMQEMKDCMP